MFFFLLIVNDCFSIYFYICYIIYIGDIFYLTYMLLYRIGVILYIMECYIINNGCYISYKSRDHAYNHSNLLSVYSYLQI